MTGHNPDTPAPDSVPPDFPMPPTAAMSLYERLEASGDHGAAEEVRSLEFQLARTRETIAQARAERDALGAAIVAHPGDTLIIAFRHRLSAHQGHEARDRVRVLVPDVRLVVVDDVDQMTTAHADAELQREAGQANERARIASSACTQAQAERHHLRDNVRDLSRQLQDLRDIAADKGLSQAARLQAIIACLEPKEPTS